VRLVNNAHDTALFVSSVPSLQGFRQPPEVVNLDGFTPMGIDLSNVIVLAGIMRESADKGIHALRAQIKGETRLERLSHTEAHQGERY